MSTPTSAPAPLTATDFMGKLTAAFTAKATLVAEVADLKAQLAVATELTTATAAAAAAAEARATAAETAKTASDSQLSTLSSQLSELAATLGLKPSELAGKSPAEIKAAQAARVELHASERLAQLGFPAAGLPPAAASSATGTADEKVRSRAEYDAMTPAARLAFVKAGGRLTD